MNEGAESGLSNAFTDLMTSLAVVFILLLCASLNNITEDVESTRSKILADLEVQLRDYDVKGVKVKSDPNDPLALLILVPEGLLDFGVNKSEIPPPGVKFLSSFIPKLTDTLYSKEFRDAISSVVVEGHTDSSGGDAKNLELSQRRSMAVVSESIDKLKTSSGSPDSDNAKRDYFLRLLSASGRGKQDLIMVNGQEDSQQSRRVIFKVRVRSFEERKLEKKL